MLSGVRRRLLRKRLLAVVLARRPLRARRSVCIRLLHTRDGLLRVRLLHHLRLTLLLRVAALLLLLLLQRLVRIRGIILLGVDLGCRYLSRIAAGLLGRGRAGGQCRWSCRRGGAGPAVLEDPEDCHG